mgnify:CR=1 FL=1
MKTVKQAKQDAYEELLLNPQYKELRKAMLEDILALADERLKQLEEENETN